jgi:uncharacterized Fe-S cluster-containing radical SAM superfamily protein
MITKQNCGCKGFQELRVAFGNMENCQLKCIFCFTREQQASTNHLSDLRRVSLEDVKIIRFTGGEPLISQNQINCMIAELSARENLIRENVDLIVVQTNGIGIQGRDISKFGNLSLPLLFEVSFKGTNLAEYQYLTFDNPISPDLAESFFSQQTQGYKHLLDTFADKDNIAVLARLGIFHSSLNSPTFKFVYPSKRGSLMFAPSKWDQRFRDVWLSQKSIWKETFSGRIVVEKIKTPADGSPGIGRRYRAIIEQLKARDLLLEDSKRTKISDEFRERYWYKKGYEIYNSAVKFIRF